MEQLLHWVEITPEIIKSLEDRTDYCYHTDNGRMHCCMGSIIKQFPQGIKNILLPVPVSKVVTENDIYNAARLYSKDYTEITNRTIANTAFIQGVKQMCSMMPSPPVNQNSEEVEHLIESVRAYIKGSNNLNLLLVSEAIRNVEIKSISHVSEGQVVKCTVKHALRLKKFHERINEEVGTNVKPYMPQSIKIAHIYKEVFSVSPVSSNEEEEEAVKYHFDINKVLRFDNPYSLPEVLKGLVEAADVLLHEKAYDRAGWERLEYCYRHGKEIVEIFEPNDANS